MKSQSTVTEILGRYKDVSPEQVQLNPTEAGIIIGGDSDPIKSGTLANWRVSGKYNLPFIKIGANVRYRLSDCFKFIEQRAHNHTGEAA